MTRKSMLFANQQSAPAAFAPRGGTIPPLLARIRSEEALLRTQFGDQYDTYCRRTSRLIPGIY
jgi:protein-S-isoprenylcysteine O-methyltransferase Ste14